MKRLSVGAKIVGAVMVFGAALFHAPTLRAEDGVFDRELEIRSYVDVFRNGNVTQATIAGGKFAESGIGDARVAYVLAERLERDYPRLTPRNEPNAPFDVNVALRNMPRVDWQYGVAMVRALASTGIKDNDGLLERIRRAPKAGGSQVKQVRAEAEKGRSRIEWYRVRNEIMSSKKNHHGGDDPRTSMLINLLTANDESYVRYAMGRVWFEHLRDPRLFAVVNDRVRQQIGKSIASTGRAGETSMVIGVRLLGVSGERDYQATLRDVLKSNPPANVKKAAQISLDQLK